MMTMAVGQGRRWPGKRQVFLIYAGGVLAGVAAALVAVEDLRQAQTAMIFAALVATGEVCRLAVPGGGEIAPAALASALGYALLMVTASNEPAALSASQVVVVTAAGMLISVLPVAAAGRRPQWDAMARRLIVVSITAFLFRVLVRPPVTHARWAVLAIMASCVVLSCIADLLIAAMVRAEETRVRFGSAFADETRALAVIYAATGATQ